MLVTLQQLGEATPRGLRARVSLPEGAAPVAVELVGDEAMLRGLTGAVDVELDYDAVVDWALATAPTWGLFPAGDDAVTIIGQVVGLLNLGGPIVDVRVGTGLVTFETEEENREGDFIAVQVTGLRCYPTGI